MIDLEAIKRRADYADEVACSEEEEGVWAAALARSCADVRALVAEVEDLRRHIADLEAMNRQWSSDACGPVGEFVDEEPF